MQTAKLGKYTVSYRNPEEFRILKREVWSRNDYYVELDNPRPVIVDAGACIGDTTLYYKQLYPVATVIAVEPYPPNFELLSKNVTENEITGVELVQAALAAKAGEVTLHADTSGYDWFTTVSMHESGWDGREKTQPIKVKGVTLLDLVPTGRIDLVKMDIEGMEWKVLPSWSAEFQRISNIVIELHPMKGESVGKLWRLLEQAGYRLEMRIEGAVVEQPEVMQELAIVTATK